MIRNQWIILSLLVIFSIHISPVYSQSTLPNSLGKWYKPENKRQVWLHTMFAMRRELQAVQEYSDQGDLEGVKKWADKLIKHYRSVPEMVPEWWDEVELETADDLEMAVAEGYLPRIESQTRKLARSCKGCHREYRVLAALRYRTAVFSTLQITDAGEEVRFIEFKEELSRTLNRINISVEDGLWAKASTALDQFELKLESYGASCTSCHEDAQPRERILGDLTSAGLDKLRKAIVNQDPKDAGRSLGGVAVDVCARCHGVHRTLSEIRQQLFGSDFIH